LLPATQSGASLPPAGGRALCPVWGVGGQSVGCGGLLLPPPRPKASIGWCGGWPPLWPCSGASPMGVASGVLALWPESGPAPGVGPPRMASAGSGPVAAPPYGCGQSEAPALAIGPSPPVGAVGRLPLPVWCSQWPVGGQRGVEGAPPLRGGQWGSGSLWPPPPEKPGWGVGVGQVSRCGVVPRVGRFFLLPASLTYPSRV